MSINELISDIDRVILICLDKYYRRHRDRYKWRVEKTTNYAGYTEIVCHIVTPPNELPGRIRLWIYISQVSIDVKHWLEFEKTWSISVVDELQHFLKFLKELVRKLAETSVRYGWLSKDFLDKLTIEWGEKAWPSLM